MKKILFYIDHRNRGGAQRVMVELANYFAQNRTFNVLFVEQYPSEKSAYQLVPEVKEYVLDLSPQIRGIRKQKLRMKHLEKICLREKPDIIISFLIISNLLALMVGKKVKIPVLISIRNDPKHDYAGIKSVLARLFYPLAAGWVFQTEDAKSYFVKSIKGKSVIILNPIAKEVMEEIETGEITDENKDNIVAVGRLERQKRHDLLIKAFQELYKTDDRVKLVIYGEGALRAELSELIQNLGLQDKVLLPGVEKNIIKKVRCARMFVLSSDYEGMPNALMEAMAAGVPVIATNCPCGGPAMLIEDRVNGMLVPTNDADSLSAAMSYLSENRDFAAEIGRKAANIRKKCQLQQVAEQWKKFIDDMLR